MLSADATSYDASYKCGCSRSAAWVLAQYSEIGRRSTTVMARFLSRTHPVTADAAAEGTDAEPDQEKLASPAVTERAGEKSPAGHAPYVRDAEWIPIERRRQKLTDLYLFAVDASLRGGADQWWRRPLGYDRLLDVEQGVASLKEFCLHHLLYEAGDVSAFCRVYEILDEEGYPAGDELDRFLVDLTRYLRSVLHGARQMIERQVQEVPLSRLRNLGRVLRRAMWPLAPPKKRPQAVVSLVIPDGMALGNFFDFCLPSLVGRGGLNSLSQGRAVSFLIFARERDLPEIGQRLEAAKFDCSITCQPIPEDLASRTEGVIGPQREWLVGALEGLHLTEARRLGADFHSLNPSALYADAFFENVSRLRNGGERAVLLATFRADAAAIRPELARFQENNALAIPAADLVSLGLCSKAPVHGATVLQDLGHQRSLASHLQVMWETSDSVQIHSTRHQIAFLAAAVMDKLPERFFMNPSAEIDRILGPDVLPHFVGESDRIAVLDVGVDDSFDGDRGDFVEFGSLILRYTRESQREYFRQPVRLAISRAACPERPRLSDAEGAAVRDAVFKPLGSASTLAAPTASHALTALNVLHQYELSEYGLENLPGIVTEGRRLLDLAQTDDGKVDDAALKDLVRASMNFDYVENAIGLAKRGGVGTAFIYDFLIEMTKLKAANEAHARRLRARGRNRRFAVVGSIVWGQPFIDKFMNYCLPSLLAPGNIPALARKRKVVHSIVTTEADRDRIVAHPAFARLKEHAEVVFTCFPPEFLQRREQANYNFYHFYGLLDHQSVFLAAALRADLYLLPIDCVYSGQSLKHFDAYLEGDADCCSVAAIESDEPGLRAWLDAKAGHQKNVLDLASVELLQAASQRPDRYFRSLIMRPENTEFCAHPRELVWPFADGLAIHSIFMHPVAVSARLLSRPFHPPHENVDFALLPRLMQGDGRLKIIEDAREAAIAHFGAPVTRDEYLDGGFSIKSFVEAHRYDYAVHRRFFATRQFFPCENPPYAVSVDYASELALIQSALVRYRFRADPA